MTTGFRLIPAGQGHALLRRLGLVLAVSLLVGALVWALGRGQASGWRALVAALVYSLSISVLTWAAIDPMRFMLRGLLRAQPPGYWPPPGRAALLCGLGIAAGYVLGTLAGDAWSGRSTLALLQTDQQRFLGVLALSLAVSFGWLTYFLERGRREALQRTARDARLSLLQSQLEPHMLFNTLANLRALIAADPRRAQQMLDHLIGFLRATLAASRNAEHALGEEFDRLRDYLALMQVRMGPRLQVQLDLSAELAAVAVPPLLLQPLVENAIRHGLEPKPQGGRVEVGARAEAGRLLLRVQDTGVGLTRQAAGTSGFGLVQVRERLAVRYGATAWLALEAVPHPAGGTLATISLPLDAPAP